MKNHLPGHPPRKPDTATLHTWHRQLLSRRRFLIGAAGGTISLLFGLTGLAAGDTGDDTWKTLGAVQNHLLPTEPGIPGAQEINALQYLKFVVSDPNIDQEERLFITQGVSWLEDLSKADFGRPFIELKNDEKERLLRKITGSSAGENWLSTLLLYLLEALLTAPAYGGNPEGIGWKWLQHIPGYPLPDSESLYGKLPR